MNNGNISQSSSSSSDELVDEKGRAKGWASGGYGALQVSITENGVDDVPFYYSSSSSSSPPSCNGRR